MDSQLSRRRFLRLAAASALHAVLCQVCQSGCGAPAVDAGPRQWVETGHPVPELVSFDHTMRDYMQSRSIPGGALAVTRHSRLVFARGYTYSNDPEDLLVQPTSLFRIASLSKPFTACSTLKLSQDGQLPLSARLVDLLALDPPAGQTPDPRLSDVTVLNLLQHLGGWDAGATFDPMFRDLAISAALGVPLPISKANITTYMTEQPLQRDPGTLHAYSNYGYALLGEIIAAISGQSYAGYVGQSVFAPLGVTRPTLGRALPALRLPDEVKYHSQYSGVTVLDDSGVTVAAPYGAWNVENMDAHGGWLASAVDVARFVSTFDDPATSPVLGPVAVETMFGLPENIDPGSYTPGDWYYGCGWAVRDWGQGVRNTWHTGSLDGTYALVVRRFDGTNWCAPFNQRDDPSGLSYEVIDDLLHVAADSVTTWPDHDLFDEYLWQERIFMPLISG